MKKYQYILLDWDGNLAKTLDIWLEACRIPLEKRGHYLSDEEIAAGFGGFIAQMQKLGIADHQAAMDEADALAKRKLPSVELYPDALEVLEYLHSSNKKLALITSSSHNNVDHLLQGYNMTHLFDVVIAGDDVQYTKPHAEPLEKALDALGGTKEESIMIGDSDKDLVAAANFGIDSALFYPPEHRKFYQFESLESLKPTYIIEA